MPSFAAKRSSFRPSRPFRFADKSERIGRNPKTGEEVPISPRRVMTFKASNVLKQKIADSHAKRADSAGD